MSTKPLDTGAILTRVLEIDNPMWDYVKQVKHSDLFSYSRNGIFTPEPWDMDELKRGSAKGRHRDYVTTQWAWAITAPESLAFITGILDGRPVVEIGAGSGYWAWMLTQLGIDVAAYDKAPVGDEDSWFGEARLKVMGERFGDLGVVPQEYHPVMRGGPEVLPHQDRDRVLLLVWPPYAGSMAYEALKAFRGDTIIFIGEGSGGCTADDAFFEAVGDGCCCYEHDDDGNVVHSHDPIEPTFESAGYGPMIQWGGIHDHINVYRRIGA